MRFLRSASQWVWSTAMVILDRVVGGVYWRSGRWDLFGRFGLPIVVGLLLVEWALRLATDRDHRGSVSPFIKVALVLGAAAAVALAVFNAW